MDINIVREKVIDTLVTRSTLNGALQRARVDKPKIEEKKSKEFRISLSKKLSETLNSSEGQCLLNFFILKIPQISKILVRTNRIT